VIEYLPFFQEREGENREVKFINNKFPIEFIQKNSIWGFFIMLGKFDSFLRKIFPVKHFINRILSFRWSGFSPDEG